MAMALSGEAGRPRSNERQLRNIYQWMRGIDFSLPKTATWSEQIVNVRLSCSTKRENCAPEPSKRAKGALLLENELAVAVLEPSQP
jgi:hypothetical protein